MAAKETLFEKVMSIGKIVVSIISGVILAVVWFESYLKTTIKETVSLAFAEQLAILKNDVRDMKPLVERHNNTLNLIEYRLNLAEEKLKIHHPNHEAILPHETKIENEE